MKFLRSRFTCIGVWFYFFFVTAFIVWLLYISYKNVGYFDARDLRAGLILYFVLLIPFTIILPICCQRIEISESGISLYFSFIRIRTFKWEEVKQVGVGKAVAGYGTYKKNIYVSNREVTSKELYDIMKVKDYRNFITFEYTEEKYDYLVYILHERIQIISAI